jgi:hypothetical protein
MAAGMAAGEAATGVTETGTGIVDLQGGMHAETMMDVDVTTAGTATYSTTAADRATTETVEMSRTTAHATAMT